MKTLNILMRCALVVLFVATLADAQVKVYLTVDGVYCARKGQKTPQGYYNIEQMIKFLIARNR